MQWWGGRIARYAPGFPKIVHFMVNQDTALNQAYLKTIVEAVKRL